MATKGQAAPQRQDLDLKHFRKLLLKAKAEAEQAIGGTRAAQQDGTGLQGMEHNELADYDENHPADAGTELFMREQDRALVDNARRILSQIERAMEKLEDGSYGICDKTHQPIPVERLEAIPYATLVVSAQSIQEIT